MQLLLFELKSSSGLTKLQVRGVSALQRLQELRLDNPPDTADERCQLPDQPEES